MSTVKTIQIKIKPKAGVSVLVEADANGIWLARLKSSPVDGKANKELIALVAQRFTCPKSAVTIKSGLSSRSKMVQIPLPGMPAAK